MSYLTRHPAAYRPVCSAQPQWGAEIDWSNPLTQGVRTAFEMNRLVATSQDSAGNMLPLSNPPYIGITKKIVGNEVFVGTEYTYSSYGGWTLPTGKGAYKSGVTVAFRIHFVATPTYSMFGSILANNLAVGFGSGKVNFRLDSGNWSTPLSATTTDVVVASGGTYTIVCTWLAGTNAMYVYVNGVSKAVTYSYTNTPATCQDVTLSVLPYGGWVSSAMKLSMLMCADAYWDQGKVTAFTNNHWQIFKPIARPYHAIDLVRGPLQTQQSYLLGTTPPARPTVAPAILRRAVMTQQPQFGAEIDWGNPVTRGLVSVCAPYTALVTDRVKSKFTVTLGGIGYANSCDGIAFSGSMRLSSGETLVTTAPFTAFALVRAIAATGIKVCSSSGNFWMGTNESSWVVSDSSIDISLASVVAGKTVALTATRSVGEFSGWVNGVYKGGRGSGFPTTSSAYVVMNYSGSSFPWDGHLYIACCWNRALSPAEIKSLSDNPWQIFKPIRQTQPPLITPTPPARPTVAPAILRRAVMTQQPQYPVEVNNSYVGDTWCASFNTLPIGSGSPIISGRQKGLALVGNGSSWYSAPTKTYSTTTGFTIIFSAGGFSSNASMLCGNTSGTDSFIWANDGSGAVRIRISGGDCSFAGTAFTNDAVGVLVMPKYAGSFVTPYLYKNGVRTSGASGFADASQLIVRAVGNGYSGSTFAINGRLYLLHIIPREITEASAKSLSDNPYQIFAAPQPRAWVGI